MEAMDACYFVSDCTRVFAASEVFSSAVEAIDAARKLERASVSHMARCIALFDNGEIIRRWKWEQYYTDPAPQSWLDLETALDT